MTSPLRHFTFQGKGKGRNISGYIVFAAEYRKEVASDNPDLSFGGISKIVGAKVRNSSVCV